MKTNLDVWYVDEVDTSEEIGWYTVRTIVGGDPLECTEHDLRGPFPSREAAVADAEGQTSVS